MKNQSKQGRKSVFCISALNKDWAALKWAPFTKALLENPDLDQIIRKIYERVKQKIFFSADLSSDLSATHERRSNFASAELSATHVLKMSAELSAAHILTMSAELSAAQSLLSALMQNIDFRPCLAWFFIVF